MIEDKELRDVFREECEEHLQALDEGLLSLEKEPAHGPTLQAVFRRAHSLKGATGLRSILERLDEETCP